MGRKKKEALAQFNRETILQSARKLFETKGIDKTTVDDIAKDADYSKSTLYVYFKGKDEILNTILLEQMEMLRDILKNCIENDHKFKENYKMLCRKLAAYQQKYPVYYELLLDEIRITKEDIEQKTVVYNIYEVGEELNKEVGRLLEKGKRERILKENLDYVKTAMFFWSGISEIIRFANQKEAYFKMRMNLSKEDYMKYGFKLLLQSVLA